MPEDFERRVVVELDPGLDAECHQLLRLDVGEEEVRSQAFIRRDRHRAANVSGRPRAGHDSLVGDQGFEQFGGSLASSRLSRAPTVAAGCGPTASH